MSNIPTSAPKVPSVDVDIDVDGTLRELTETERSIEVERVLKAFKLNPWEQLGVDLEEEDEKINKIYRAKSLLIHPDKCKHPDAKKAFQILASAKKGIAEEGRINVVKAAYKDSTEMLLHTKQLKPNDPYLKTDEFKEEHRKAVNRILGEIEWRKIQLQKRLTEEEGREKQKAEERKEERIKKEEADKVWEGKRDTRVADWRNFIKNDQKKKEKKKKKDSDIINSAAFKIAAAEALKNRNKL